MNAPTDFLGRTIKAGDTVVYPWRRGSQMGMNRLTVTQVLDTSIMGNSPTGRLVRVQNLKNVVVVEPVETTI
jgi:hypothetical protein